MTLFSYPFASPSQSLPLEQHSPQFSYLIPLESSVLALTFRNFSASELTQILVTLLPIPPLKSLVELYMADFESIPQEEREQFTTFELGFFSAEKKRWRVKQGKTFSYINSRELLKKSGEVFKEHGISLSVLDEITHFATAHGLQRRAAIRQNNLFAQK